MTNRELGIVMPAYNEAAAIEEVVSTWVEELERLNIDYELRIYDDGSRDRTAAVARHLSTALPRVQLIQHMRRGHGPTILAGYRETQADWILQIDSDGELRPTEFASMWRRRASYDLILGQRQRRRVPVHRRTVSWLARTVARWTFGSLVQDVNCPYRLMRRQCFEPLFSLLPRYTFAPNVALAGLASAAGMSVLEVPVECHSRIAGQTSLRPVRFVRAAFCSFWQTLLIAARFRTRRLRLRQSIESRV